jgi:hypothetical protein
MLVLVPHRIRISREGGRYKISRNKGKANILEDISTRELEWR